ncbi:hypothetical protein Bca52824_090187 [Brassica carinata]|uniref:Uncharacterized protein n=1 Tax=Brassica carinata TaxID=52824 RepID=A0A8X7P1F6_BRACI|nr:hypothetical protein Bca52824_090187 [Brassica carinata]
MLKLQLLRASPEKKVRKMRSSPFNKKSSSVVGRLANTKIEEEGEEESVETVASETVSARTKRANRRQMRFVLTAE